MPKKKADPITTILDYFESAPKESCEQALALAKRAMGKRFTAVPKPPGSRPRRVERREEPMPSTADGKA